jgi:integrase
LKTDCLAVAKLQKVRTAGSRFSKECGDLVQFLAYSGAGKGEAARVLGSDCDFANGRITIKGDSDTGTKNGEIRIIPVIPDMRRLLERIHSEKGEAQWLNNQVVGVRECQKGIDSACKKLGITRFTHHDLRHLFATLRPPIDPLCLDFRPHRPVWPFVAAGGHSARSIHLRINNATSFSK